MKYIAYILLPAIVILAIFLFRDKEEPTKESRIERTYIKAPLLDSSFDPRNDCPNGFCKG